MKRYIRYDPFDIYCFETDLWEHPVHKHTYYEVIFIIEGRGKHNINDNTCPYDKGDVFLLGPEDFHFFKIDTLTKFCFIRFTDLFFGKSLSKDQISWHRTLEFLLHSPYHKGGSMVENEQEKKILDHLLQVLLLEYKERKEGSYEIMMDSLMKSIFTIISRNIIKQSINDDKSIKKTEPIEEILMYISQNIHNPEHLKIDHLADRCRYSPKYLSIFFKRQTGESLQHYILKYKINLIMGRLQFSELSISQIAYEFGFTDESHLYKIFKKYQGISPKEYRLEKRGTE